MLVELSVALFALPKWDFSLKINPPKLTPIDLREVKGREGEGREVCVGAPSTALTLVARKGVGLAALRKSGIF
jgi:hypothetical protein